jgi:hypothetical protein
LLQLLHVDELESAHAAHALALPDAARVLPDDLDEVSGLNTSRIMAQRFVSGLNPDSFESLDSGQK